MNFAVPLARLREEALSVAREIAGKDGAALKATKDGYRFSLEMSWEAGMNYSKAKEKELSSARTWMEEG